MADYLPLIMRAINSLPHDGEDARSRENVYERARSALLNELMILKPPLAQSDIEKERIALDAAIIEAESKAIYKFRIEKTRIKSTSLKDKLAEVVSPEPGLSRDGKLNASANKIYDQPDGSDDFVTLPIRQNALIKTIRAGLPKNSPRQLKIALENYSEELTARASQPILGLLKDMADVISADVGSQNASREWLEDGLAAAFQIFLKNHTESIAHFPLDKEREELYRDSSVYEELAEGKDLIRPFEMVAQASQDAIKAGLATRDFVMAVDKLAEFAKVVASQPVRQEPAIDLQSSITTPKKRAVLTGFGFFERAYNILGSTATLSGPPAGNALLTAMQNALAALSKFIGF